MEETKVRDNNTKTQLSLAAALFFSPLVKYILNKNTWNITKADESFIRGYITLGYITLFLGVVVLTSSILHYAFVLNIFNSIYTISIFLLLVVLIVSVVSILSDVRLIQGDNLSLPTQTIEGNKKNILLTYLPIYNTYLWYRLHNFEQPNRWIKESIFLRILFFLVSITGIVRGTIIVLLLIIVRVASLASDIDILDISVKRNFNKLFTKNPEEIRGYVVGFLSYLIQSIVHLVRPSTHYSLDTEIDTAKESYSRIIDIKKNRSLIGEYILGFGIIGGIIYLISPDFTVRTYYAGLGLLLLRYITMAIQLKHLPHFPIAREIILLVKKTGKLFIRNT